MKKCIACGERLSAEPLMKLKNMPVSAQGLPTKNTKDKDSGIDVNVCVCEACGLVQLDSKPVPYYRDVIRSGGYSTTMEKLRRKEYREFIKFFGLEGRRIVEAGCGRGEFLKTLTEFPVKAYGIEHKKSLVQIAKDNGLRVTENFPSNIKFDAFTSFNFLEHQPNPRKYLLGIAEHLKNEAYGLITVPDLNYILEKKAYYEIIPDHLSYFTENSLKALLGSCGFEVMRSRIVNRDTIEVFVKRTPATDFAPVVKAMSGISKDLNAVMKKGRSVAVWGASHQGFTILATTGIKPDFIIDSAQFKQGRLAPASHIEIISPEEAAKKSPDTIIIIAPGYSDEIAGIIRRDFKKGTSIYTLQTERLEKLS